jgi:hypothetical protein
VERTIDTVMVSSSFDKPSERMLSQLLEQATQQRIASASSASASGGESPDTEAQTDFASLAAGLADLVELSARTGVLDQSMASVASDMDDMDDIDMGMGGMGMNSAPGSAVKPLQPRASAGTPSRASARRTSARPASYKESEGESESEKSESDDSEEEGAEEEEEEEEVEGEEEGEEEQTEGDAAAAAMDAVSSPTKHFVLKTGRSSGSKGSKGKGKKITFQDEAIDENASPNYF